MMHPRFFGWHMYPICQAVAVCIGVAASSSALRQQGLKMREVVRLQVVLLMVSVIGAKAYGLIEQWAIAGHASVTLRTSGLRYPGAVLAAFAAMPILLYWRPRRIGVASVADAMAPGIAVAIALARIGCFLEGCCYGRASTLPWAVRFPAGSLAWTDQVLSGQISSTTLFSLPVHPLQWYFGAWSLTVAVIVWLDRRWKRYDGHAILLFVLLHEGGKAALESLRAPQPLVHLQLTSVALAAGAALVLCIRGLAGRRQNRIRSKGDQGWIGTLHSGFEVGPIHSSLRGGSLGTVRPDGRRA